MQTKQYAAKLDLLSLDDEDLFGIYKPPERDWIPLSPKKNEHKKRVLQTQGNQNRQERCLPQLHKNYKDNLKRLLKSLQDSRTHSPKKRSKPVQDQNQLIDIVQNNFIRHSGNKVSVQGLVNSRDPSQSRKYKRPLTQSSQKILHCLRGSAFLNSHMNQQLEIQQKIKQKLFQKESERNLFVNNTNFLRGTNQNMNTTQGLKVKRNILCKKTQLRASKNTLNFLLS